MGTAIQQHQNDVHGCEQRKYFRVPLDLYAFSKLPFKAENILLQHQRCHIN